MTLTRLHLDPTKDDAFHVLCVRIHKHKLLRTMIEDDGKHEAMMRGLASALIVQGKYQPGSREALPGGKNSEKPLRTWCNRVEEGAAAGRYSLCLCTHLHVHI